MKTTIRKSTFKAIYRLLDRVSPVAYDCGTLCSHVCCCTDGKNSASNITPVAEKDLGIYLLPGEEKLFSRSEDWLSWSYEYAEDYDFPDSWNGKVHFVKCKTPPLCPRKNRPLQCRFYPLMPLLDEQDNLSLVFSKLETPYLCPLITNKTTLDPRFIKATHTVWRRLLQDPLIYDLVKMDSIKYHLNNY